MRVADVIQLCLVVAAGLVVLTGRAQSAPPSVDAWLGLWCSDDDRIAVINYGIAPYVALQQVRAQLPETHALVGANIRLGPPRHKGACMVPSIGLVRVTSYTRPDNLHSRQNFCETTMSQVAWIGPRRVVDRASHDCKLYALVVTSSAVFRCASGWVPLSDTVEPVRCEPIGPPHLLGHPDSSMYAPDGAPRPVDGFALRYGERSGGCDPFFVLTKNGSDSMTFAVERGRLVLRRSKRPPGESVPIVLSNIEWRELRVTDRGISGAALDFLGRGRSDAVYRIERRWYDRRRDFFESFFIVVPGRGTDLEEIGRYVSEVSEIWQHGPADRATIADRVGLRYEDVIVIDATGIADVAESDRLEAVRDRGVTYTILYRDYWWSHDSLALALSRVEKDGRQTPICMYDRSRPPPHAAW